MCVDVCLGKGVVRLVAGYAPHMGYPQENLHTLYDQTSHVLRDLDQKCVATRFPHTARRWGARTVVTKYVFCSFAVDVANGTLDMQNWDDIWTCPSFAGIQRRIDFFLYSRNLPLNRGGPQMIWSWDLTTAPCMQGCCLVVAAKGRNPNPKTRAGNHFLHEGGSCF